MVMPKGQQRGNKEAKKPKKAPVPAPIPVASGSGARPQDAGAPHWPKKK
jgi:hypothetical protein